MATTTTAKPSSYDELCLWYYDWVVGLVRRAGIPAQDVDDVAQDILEAEFKSGVLEMYDPEYQSEHQGKVVKVTFRSFLSSRVMLRCRGKRETITKRAMRELLLVDTTDESGARWIDLFVGGEWDDYSEIDAKEFIDRMRAYLATVPRKSPQDSCDLLALFDELLHQVNETGEVSSAAIQERFGIADATATAWLARLRQIMTTAGDLPAPEKHVIGGVTLTLPEIYEAISILQSAKGIMVHQPLSRAGHPLANAEKGWYHPFSKEERKAYPVLEVDPQTHQKPADHVKRAVLHRLQRMLGTGLAEVPAQAGLAEVPAQAEPPAVPASAEPISPLELIEARIWTIGGSQEDVEYVLAQVQQLAGV